MTAGVVRRLPVTVADRLRGPVTAPTHWRRHRAREALLQVLRRGGIPAGVTTFSLRDNRGADVRNADSLVLRQLYWFGEQGWEPQLVPWWRRFLPPLLGHSGTRRERRLLRRVTQTISVPAVDVRSLLSELTCSSWIWRGRSMRCSRRAGSTCAPANQRSLSKCCPGLQASAAACGPVPRRRLPRLRAARRLPAPVEAPDILPAPLLDRYGCQDMILSAEPHVDRWPPTQEGTKLDVQLPGQDRGVRPEASTDNSALVNGGS